MVVWLVVYLYIPTSNHNDKDDFISFMLLYIFIFLHQTTTCHCAECFEYGLYIFIFLHQTTTGVALSDRYLVLYIFIFLHQTTTSYMSSSSFIKLYIFIFLHQTTTSETEDTANGRLYIFIFLHQTTTNTIKLLLSSSCISLYSYIKPQQTIGRRKIYIVVYLYIPTSNHNIQMSLLRLVIVVYLYIPTSNHNNKMSSILQLLLYIFIFLHQTTTAVRLSRR